MKTLSLIVPLTVALVILSAGETAGLTLQAALQAAVEKNPEIQKAKYKVEQAGGQRLVFRAVALPDALVGIVGGVQGGYRAGQDSTQPFGFAYGVFSQPFFDARIPASYRRGNVELLIAQQQLNIAMETQLHATRLAFYSALYNRSLQTLHEGQRRHLEENVSSQKARYEAGLADRSALTSAQLQTRELDPRVESARRGYADARLKLSEAIGNNLEANATLPEPEGDLAFVQAEVDLDEQTTAALERRADLKLARLLIKAANEDQKIIEAGYYPVINATMAGEFIPVSGIHRESSGSPRRTDDIVSSEVRLGGVYSWRVIDNGKVYGAVMQQRQIREINELELRKLEAAVPRDLSRIRNNLQAIATKQQKLVGATAAAELNAKIVQENLAGGLASQYEYRLMESTLLETRSAVATLAFQQMMALAEWDRGTGRYFQFSDDTAPNLH